MSTLDVEQRSAEWMAARLGKEARMGPQAKTKGIMWWKNN